jgi:predicted Holliday junction resolvase-like endonuclease
MDMKRVINEATTNTRQSNKHEETLNKQQKAAERMRLYRSIDAVFTRDVDKLDTCNYISYFSYHETLLSVTEGSG